MNADAFIARTIRPQYEPVTVGRPPELDAVAPTTTLLALRELFIAAELDSKNIGKPEWNPLGGIISPGDRVLIKPNWVMHRHRDGSSEGMECLVTHPSLIESVLAYVVKAQPSEVVIGDAPLQGCDFVALTDYYKLGDVIERVRGNCKVAVRDFRLTTLRYGALQLVQATEQALGGHIEFDLGARSVLEPITKASTDFRVTLYDPEKLRRTHAPGRHTYLIAREVLDANVVISLPKLKTHMKAGITGALKNMVGINGHKEYLPHHRKGGPAEGGDCYAASSTTGRLVENALDFANTGQRPFSRWVLNTALTAYDKLLHVTGSRANFEGAWFGNDTIWRTCHDLIRILHYGTKDGRLASERQRKTLTITDAIVAGAGDGPLAPTPVPLGVLTLGASEPELDWVHANLMRIDPMRIPIIARAFDAASMPLARTAAADIRVRGDLGPMTARETSRLYGRRFLPPLGWRGHCELGAPR